jgi:hypothetical protein
MYRRLHSPGKAAAAPSTSLHSGVLQRKCARAASSDLTPERELTLQRSPVSPAVGFRGPSRREDPGSSGSSLTDGRGLDNPRLGHDFGRVRVQASGSDALQLQRSTTNPAQHLTIKGQLVGEESSSTEQSSEAPEEAVVEPSDSAVETQTSQCPVTAVFSSTIAGGQKANCLVPDKQFGAATLARFVLRGLKPGAGSQTINEQFKKIEDKSDVFKLLKPNSYTTSGNIFDDCYLLASKEKLPADFVLKVEQNHLLNGQIISKNIITYTPDRISIRPCKRVKGSCNFVTLCRS